jgi:peptide/nickel transport system substrate-binding protein
MPQAVYFTRASKLEFSAMLLGWGAETGEPSSPLKSFLATNNPAKGFGTANRGRYSNLKLDALLQEALETVDDEKRSGLLQRATEVGIEDVGIIPLHYEVTLWGMRSDLAFEGNTNQYTLAFDIHPVMK